MANTSIDLPEFSRRQLESESLPSGSLIQRLSTEVAAANERVRTLREEAAKVFKERERRLLKFTGAVDYIYSLLLPRLHAFMNLEPFRDATISERIDLAGPLMRCSHSRTTMLTLLASDLRPVPMKIVFTVGPDSPVQEAILDYRLQFLPIFIPYDKHDQLAISIKEPAEAALVEWIDDKLVGFTRTYFGVLFHHEYQERCLQTDPVMRIAFPMAFAESKAEYLGQTYYFYTAESKQVFEQDPTPYVNGEAST